MIPDDTEANVALVFVQAWTEVCCIAADGGTDLFDIGGDSLSALQVIEFATSRLDLPLQAQEFLLPQIFIERTPDACAAALVSYLREQKLLPASDEGPG